MGTDTPLQGVESTRFAPSSLRMNKAIASARRPAVVPHTTTEVVRLKDGALWAHVPSPAGLSIGSVSGSLWITQAGAANDVIVREGQSFSTFSRGKVVVQGIDDAAFWFEDRGSE